MRDRNETKKEWIIPFLMFEAGILALLVAIALVGNIFTLIVVAQNRTLRKENFLFIPSLAVADSLAGIGLTLSLVQIPGLWCVSFLGGTLTMMMVTCALFVSHVHILAMALQRFLAISFPLKYGMWISTKRMCVVIAGMWTVGVVYAMTFLSWGWEDSPKKNASNPCRPSHLSYHVPRDYIGWSQSTVFLLVLCTLLATYGNVLRVARSQAARVHSHSLASHNLEWNDHQGQVPEARRGANSEPRKALKFIVVAIGAYVLTWFMFFCVRVAVIVRPELASLTFWVPVEFSATLISFSNSSLNIFIYSYYLSEFREAYKRLLCYFLRRDMGT